ncbi:hypothetical protein B484DRAFT_401450 [Ochromonadaceae sp. CCMP2298]|nr:hypothetical protein B484DRAFT_401450 [Ochromonadaceae sp. CCMP2298]
MGTRAYPPPNRNKQTSFQEGDSRGGRGGSRGDSRESIGGGGIINNINNNTLNNTKNTNNTLRNTLTNTLHNKSSTAFNSGNSLDFGNWADGGGFGGGGDFERGEGEGEGEEEEEEVAEYYQEHIQLPYFTEIVGEDRVRSAVALDFISTKLEVSENQIANLEDELSLLRREVWEKDRELGRLRGVLSTSSIVPSRVEMMDDGGYSSKRGDRDRDRGRGK